MVIPAGLCDELMQLGCYVELYESAEKYIGKVMVTAPEPTLEEMRARSASPGPWYTTEEVLAHCRARAGQNSDGTPAAG